MSLQGLWTSEPYGLYGWENNGVMVLKNGWVLGGGRHHYSVGSYEDAGKEFAMSLDVEYHGQPWTLYGYSDKQISLKFVGEAGDGTIEGSVFRPQNPKQSLMFRLTKRAEIP